MNNDTLKYIVIILNNDRAAIDKLRKDIHVLNKVLDPYSPYKEASIEPIPDIIKRDIKFQQALKIITIKTPQKTHRVDLEKFNYDNPHDPYVDMDTLKYHIEDGNLMGEMNVCVVVDDRATGGIIGTVRIKYSWENGRYRARDLNFISLI